MGTFQTLAHSKPFGPYSRFRVDVCRDRFGSLCAIGFDADCEDDVTSGARMCAMKIAGIGGVPSDVDAFTLEALARQWIVDHYAAEWDDYRMGDDDAQCMNQ